jgi:Transposase DDE domain
MASVQAPLTDAEFTSAVELLRRIIPEGDFPAYSLNVSPATVYTTLVTLWMLTLQRLGGGKSMACIIKDVLTYHRDFLPENKRVREATLSERSGAYSQARKRLPLETVRAFAERVSQSLIERSPAWFQGRRAFIIDGTTMTLSPTSSLRDAYPPATNQHGETVWPVLMLMVAHELQSGCALIPEFGAMYGPNNTSEACQATAIGLRIPIGSLILADAGFGIFQVAYKMVGIGHDILLRLTKSRFKSLYRKAKTIRRTAKGVHYRLTWPPSLKDRKANPDLPADASLEVDLHEVTLENGEPLYLVTTLKVSSETAAKFYRRRYDVEHDIRDMKVSLGIENIRAKSDEMVQKELLCSVVAYNLVVELRREAAKIAKVEPRRLSFTGVWTTMQVYLLQQPPCSASEWRDRYERALQSAAKEKLPIRAGRSYPRQAHPRRSKSTKFMKQEAKEKQRDPPGKLK